MPEIDLKRTASKYPYTTPWFNVREDTVKRLDGTEMIFYIVECPDGVFIIPVTESGKIILVKLFRYRTQRSGWEVPAGSIDPGEDKFIAAKRELQEEQAIAPKSYMS